MRARGQNGLAMRKSELPLQNAPLGSSSTRLRVCLVAVAGADGDLMTALGAAAAQHGRTRFGLHAGQKPVGLRAVATVRLESTLRHLTRLLLNLFFCGLQQSLSIPEVAESP